MAWLISPWNRKAKLWVKGRKGWYRELNAVLGPNEPVTWFHCASLGEFEQGRPIIEASRDSFPGSRVLLTFFSLPVMRNKRITCALAGDRFRRSGRRSDLARGQRSHRRCTASPTPDWLSRSGRRAPRTQRHHPPGLRRRHSRQRDRHPHHSHAHRARGRRDRRRRAGRRRDVRSGHARRTRSIFEAGGWTLLTAVNLMLFSLIHNPCSTTIYTIWKETGSVKWTVLSTVLPLVHGIRRCASRSPKSGESSQGCEPRQSACRRCLPLAAAYALAYSDRKLQRT